MEGSECWREPGDGQNQVMLVQQCFDFLFVVPVTLVMFFSSWTMITSCLMSVFRTFSMLLSYCSIKRLLPPLPVALPWSYLMREQSTISRAILVPGDFFSGTLSVLQTGKPHEFMHEDDIKVPFSGLILTEIPEKTKWGNWETVQCLCGNFFILL